MLFAKKLIVFICFFSCYEYSVAVNDTSKTIDAATIYKAALLTPNADSATKYQEQAFLKADEANDVQIKFLSAFQLSKNYIESNKLQQALKFANIAVQYASIQNKPAALNRLAAVYYNLENYSEALKIYINIADITTDNESLELAYRGIASVYVAQKKYSEAIDYYEKSIQYIIKRNAYEQKADVFTNIAATYSKMNDRLNTLKFYKEAIKIYDINNLDESKAHALIGLGIEYLLVDSLTEARRKFIESQKIFLKSKYYSGVALAYFNLTDVAYREKKYSECEKLLKLAEQIANDLNNFELKKTCYQYFHELYNTTKQFDKAYDYSLQHAAVKDSINNRLFNDKIAQQETIHKTKEKEAEIDRQNIENKGLKTRQYLLIAISVLGLIVLVVIFYQYQQKQKINKDLEFKNKAIRNQKREIENQSRVLEVQNKEITDSINYALQIQNAIFPKPEYIYKNFANHFILYQPKSVVSGDFYFYTETPDKFIFAAVDCTGHGVPGALMSMVGNNLLNQIIIEKNIVEPALILNKLNKGVQKVLQQDEQSNSRDGMDIALIAFNKDKTKLEYAGANRPLYILRDKKLIEIKSDKSAIGGYQTDTEKQFTNHQIELMQGDTIYLFSDGYADQFGGEKGKKLMVKTLQQLLISIVDFDMNTQKQKLASYFTNWKGANEQIDDVLLIGIKV